jgi:hypothetical protein
MKQVKTSQDEQQNSNFGWVVTEQKQQFCGGVGKIPFFLERKLLFVHHVTITLAKIGTPKEKD